MSQGSNVGNVYVTVVPTMKGTAKAVEAAFDGTGERVGEQLSSGIESKVSTGAVAIGNALANAITSAVGNVGDLVAEGIASSDALTRFGTSMEFAGFDPETIDAARADIKEYADQTVYDLDTVLNTASQLASNGVADFEALTEAAGNLNAVAGGNAATFRSVSMVMTQTASTGRLTWENWLQLIEAVPGAAGPVLDALRDMGAYTGDFQEALSDGEVTAEEFNAAIMEVGSDPIAVEAAASVETFEGAVGNAKAAVVDGFREMWDAANDDGRVTEAISDVGDALGDMLRDAAPVFGDMVELASDLVEGVSDIPAPVKATAVAVAGAATAFRKLSAAKSAVSGVATAVKSLSTAMGGVVSLGGSIAALGLVTVIGTVVQGIADTEAAMDEARQRAEDLETAAGGVASALAAIDGGALYSVSGGASDAASSMAGASEAAASFRDRMVESTEASRDAVSEAADGFREMAQGVADLASGAATVEGYAATIDELRDRENLTASEQNRLSDAVDAFNEATGASVGIVDEQNGVLDTSRERIEAITDAYIAQARVQGYQGTLSQLYSDQAAQMQDVERAADDLGDAYLRLWDEAYGAGAVDEFARGMMVSREELARMAVETDGGFELFTQSLMEATGQTVAYGQSVGQAGGASAEAREAVSAAAEAYGNYSSVLDGTNASIELYEGALDDAAAGAEKAGEAVGEAGEKAEEAGEKAGASAERLKELNAALEPALKGMRGSAQGAGDLAAALDGIAASADPVADALAEAERALDDFDRAGGDIADLTREVNAALQETGDVTVDLTEEQMLYAYQAGMTVDQLHAYAVAQSEASAAAEEASEAAREAAEEQSRAVEETLDAMGGLVDGAPAVAAAIEATGQSVDAFALRLGDVGSSVDEFRGRFESLAGVSNPLSAIEQETGVYTWQMRDNLLSNIDAVNQWSANITELYSRCTNDQELAFAQYVESMGVDNAEFLNYLLYDADVSFQELAQLYAQAQQAQADAAVQVTEAGAEAAVECGVETAEAGADAVADASGGIAEDATGAIAEGFGAGTGEVVDSADLLGERTVEALMDLPEEMRARGEAAGGYLALGLAQGTASIPGGIGSVVSSVAGGLSGMPDAMRTVGETGGQALGLGVASATGAASEAASALVSACAGGLEGFSGSMGAVGTAGGESFAGGVEGEAGAAGSAASSLSAACASALSGFAGSMRAVGTTGGKSFGDGVQYQMGNAYSSAWNLASAALSALGSFNASAYASGAEMGGNFAAGLASQINTVALAASSAASAVSDRLHFTEPKVGPLVGINDSGGEMVRNYAASMLGAVPELEDASNAAAAAARIAAVAESGRRDALDARSVAVSVQAAPVDGGDERQALTAYDIYDAVHSAVVSAFGEGGVAVYMDSRKVSAVLARRMDEQLGALEARSAR